MGDTVDQAIAAAQPQQLVQRSITINSTGRMIVIAHPPDMTDEELLSFIGWASGPLRVMLDQERQALRRIVVPAGLVLPS